MTPQSRIAVANPPLTLDRRRLLQTALAGALLPASLNLTFPARAATAGHTLVVIFLRGAMDGLNLVAPADDADYVAARPEALRVTVATGLPLANGPTAQNWRLHPGATALKGFFDAGQLAFVHASGLKADTRSHFQAQDLMERGITDAAQIGSAKGWIVDWLAAANVTEVPFTTVAASALAPSSLTGDYNAIGMDEPDAFSLDDSDFSDALTAAYATNTGRLGQQGATALAAMAQYDAVRQSAPSSTAYAKDGFSQGLNVVANLIGIGLAPRVATLEFDNWDTHDSQASRFSANIAVLNAGLNRFWTDMAARRDKITVILMSEFGRRVAANASGGTDHGHGNVLTVLGGGVAGGKIYGRWPGLGAGALDHGDLAITTDYRQVLCEILKASGGLADPAAIFPGFVAGTALGIIRS